MSDELHVSVAAAHGGAPPIELERIAAAVRHVLRAERVAAAEVSVALLDDARIGELNRDYLGHDGPTDVISFPLYEPGRMPVGDVYIGVAQAERQARELGVPLAEELLRLAIHGTLHVLGYDHPEGEEREGCAMYLRQEALLRDVLAG